MGITDFSKELDRLSTEKTNKILKDLPYYVKDYFSSRRINTSARTRLSYAYDIRKFFLWLKNNNPELKNVNIKDIPLDSLNNLNTRDIEEYIDFITTDKESCNTASGVARKLASLGSFFNYLLKHEMVIKNPCSILYHLPLKEPRI